MIKYIFFDVSGTLLGKPSLWNNINEVLKEFGHSKSLQEIKYKHKLLSEVIHFPDRTDAEFYTKFNSEFLRLLGIIPDELLVNAMFKKCTYLPWEKYDDTDVLSQLTVPLGIVSNFNTTLGDKLNAFFGPVFSHIIVSETEGVAKPDPEFYQRAIDKVKLTPEEILYIGDSIRLDLEPAMRLGIKSVLIDRDNFYPESHLRIKHLSEIKSFL